MRATHARERTRAGGAPRYTQEPWEAVEAKLAEAEQAFTRQAYAQADQLFAAATDTYRHLEEAAREARRRERDAALRAREQMAQVRQAIQTDNSPPYAPTVWEEAEARSIQAEAAFAREEYAEAREGFEAADSAYRRVEEVAREARHRERDAVEQAREKAKAGRERALSASAPQYARGPWDAAEAQLVAAQTAFSAELLTRAVDLFNDALTLYVSAEKTAAEAVQRERRSAEEAQERVREALRAAAAADSERQAPSVWNAAATKSAEGETALFNRQYRQAVTSFSEALALYQKAENESRETRQQQRGQAELAHRAMVERRQAALAADAAVHAASQWHDAETSAEFGEAALAREAYTEARAIFDQTAGLYRSAEELAREAARTIAIARTDAEKARDATVPARRAAAEAQASRYAADRWRAGEDAEAQARAALSRAEHVAARSLFAEARRQYAAAGHAASIALEAENRRADAMVSVARQLLASGDIDACLRRLNEVLAFRPDHAGAQRLLQEAGPQSAADLSHAERAREAAKLARLAAAAAQAEQYTPEQWRASENVEADAASALERRDYAAASALFADAERLYATAAQAAGVAQTTETRRIDEMVADAQRLLIESEIQRCLDRLTEVLAIRPGHAVAERLRLEARSRLRRAEVDSANGETVYSGRTSVSLDQIAPEEQTARSSVPTDATVFAPPPVRDPSNAESPPHAEAPPMIVGAPTRTDTPTVDPGDLSRGLGPDLPGNIAQRTRTPRRLTVRGRGMVLAFGSDGSRGTRSWDLEIPSPTTRCLGLLLLSRSLPRK